MKTAVVYFSLEGNTRMVAERVAEKLGADLIELVPVTPYPTKGAGKFFWGGKSSTMKEKPALQPYAFRDEEYDTVVLGAPLWAWNLTPPMRTFLAEHDLSKKRVAAFMSCMGGSTKKAFEAICQETGHARLDAEMTLVNPLKNSGSIDGEIEAFCGKLRG